MITLTMEVVTILKRFPLILNMLKLSKNWQNLILIGERQQKNTSQFMKDCFQLVQVAMMNLFCIVTN